MKRDWDIIRDVLLALEASPSAKVYLRSNQLTQYPEQDVAYNMKLLHDAGFVEGRFSISSSGDGQINLAIILNMANTGHDLLDTIRSATVWTKIKESFKTKGLDMTAELVLLVGRKIVEGMI